MKAIVIWATEEKELQQKFNAELAKLDDRNFLGMSQSTLTPDITTDVSVICVTILVR